MMLDAGLEHTGGEYGMRWIAESREGARGASDSRIYASEIEAQLAAIHELMGAHHRTLGLGRRLAIRLGPKKARDPTIESTHDGAVLHVELERRDGSDLARAWSRGLRSVLRRSTTRAEARLLDAFEQALLAQRPGRATRSERMREEWFGRTFEAFIDAEGWSCAGGDVAATTRTAAKREATGPKAAKYPDPGPARERWAWLPSSDSVRERTNWLWHMFRAAIEWDIDCPGLRGSDRPRSPHSEVACAQTTSTQHRDGAHRRLLRRSPARIAKQCTSARRTSTLQGREGCSGRERLVCTGLHRSAQ